MSESATYDIAVSFAEEQRAVVGDVVEACRQRGLTVLHGPDHTHEWWAHKEGGDLPQAQVRFFLVFVSSVDDFTTDVLRAVKDGAEHVLPVLVDVTVPAGLLHPHVTYLRANEQLIEELAGRVESAETAGRDRSPVAEVVAGIKKPGPAPVTPATFSRYTEQDAALRYLGEQFAAALPGVVRRGLAGTVHVGDATIAVRVERAGDTVFALDIQRGGIGGDETVNFVVGRHDKGSACSNGWARPVYSAEAGVAVLELHDLSVLGGSTEQHTYSREELFAALWRRIDDVVTATVR